MRVVWFYCLSYKTNNYLSIKSSNNDKKGLINLSTVKLTQMVL